MSTPDELGLDGARSQPPQARAGGGSRIPERGEGAEMIDGSPAEVAARIVEIVRERMAG